MKKIYNFRYLIALLILVICVIFEIHGSSINLWGVVSNSDIGKSLFGKSRIIRTDEWVVNTPIAFSQYYNDFKYKTDILRAEQTDVFLLTNAPIRDISMIFRPFVLGYLFLSPAKGLAFYWCFRILALTLVTFEFAQIVTNKNKKLALIACILISFSPPVHWWSLIELLVSAEIALICLDKLMQESRFKVRALLITIIAWCAGCYALSFYPAWQISIFYISLPFAIWIIYKNYKACKMDKKDIFVIVLNLLWVGVLLGRVFIKSQDIIFSLLNTAYPGARISIGGNGLTKLLISNVNLITSFFKYENFAMYDMNALCTNACEVATIIDFMPATIVLVICAMKKEKINDFLLNICVIFSLILNFYCIIGFPRFVSKITLLSFVTTDRLTGVIGILNVFILVRCLLLLKNNVISPKASAIISAVFSIIFALIIYKYMQKLMDIRHIIILVLPFMLSYFFILQFKTEHYDKFLIMMVVGISLVSTVYINPINTGISVIEDNKLGKRMIEINNEDDGIWVTQGIHGNFPVLYGLKCLNSINTYPDVDRWKALDKDGQNEEIYNRYAHLLIKIEGAKEEKFKLVSPDTFEVTLNLEELKNMNVKYILNFGEFENKELENSNVTLTQIDSVNNFYIYKIVEKEEV